MDFQKIRYHKQIIAAIFWAIAGQRTFCLSKRKFKDYFPHFLEKLNEPSLEFGKISPIGPVFELEWFLSQMVIYGIECDGCSVHYAPEGLLWFMDGRTYRELVDEMDPELVRRVNQAVLDMDEGKHWYHRPFIHTSP